jgi:hypothetical protein
MIDRAKIFHLLTLRNALRVANGLPRLNLAREYRHEVALALENDFRDFAAEHEPERLMIREQVIAELRQEHGPDFGYSPTGRFAINRLTNDRFRAHLYYEYGIGAPPSSANPITYGGESAS